MRIAWLRTLVLLAAALPVLGLDGSFDEPSGTGVLREAGPDGTPVAARSGWQVQELVPLGTGPGASVLVLWATWPQARWLSPELWTEGGGAGGARRLWPATGERIAFPAPDFELEPGPGGARLAYTNPAGERVEWQLGPEGGQRVAAPAGRRIPLLPMLRRLAEPPLTAPPGPGYEGLAGGPAPAGPVGKAEDLPIMRLKVGSADAIDDPMAERILAAAGFMSESIQRFHQARLRRQLKGAPVTAYQAALMAFLQGHAYKVSNRPIALDDQLRGWLLSDLQGLKAALLRYPLAPEIGQRTRAKEFDAWVRAVAKELHAVDAKERYGLMRSLMQSETDQTHWVGFVPVVSFAGAVGFGQLLPATAAQVGVNPYDPAENIRGVALHLNGLIRQAQGKGLAGHDALRHALAGYNGGDVFPKASLDYADLILDRVGL